MQPAEKLTTEYPEWIMRASLDPQSAVNDVMDFAAHTEDHKVTLNNLRVARVGDSKTYRLQWNRGAGDMSNFLPTEDFWNSFARFLNAHTDVARASGRNFDSMFERVNDVTKPSIPLAQMDQTWPDSRLLPTSFALFMTSLLGELDNVYRHRDKTRKELLLRTIVPGTEKRWCKEPTARALLFEGYRDDISHKWLLKSLHKMTLSGRIMGWHFSGDLMKGGWFIPSTSRVEPDSEYGGGVFFYQGEVGNRRCGVAPFVYRNRTGTITLFQRLMGTGWSTVHSSGQALDTLYRSLATVVDKQIKLTTVAIDKLIEAKEKVVPDDVTVEQVILAVASSGDFSRQALRTWRDRVFEEQALLDLPLSVFTIQTGLTMLAKDVDDPIQQLRYEMFGGSLLDEDWDKLFRRALTVEDAQVKKTFGTD